MICKENQLTGFSILRVFSERYFRIGYVVVKTVSFLFLHVIHSIQLENWRYWTTSVNIWWTYISLMVWDNLFSERKKVRIIKLPAHTTDVLQPLDVSVFKSLKDDWGSILFKRLKIKRKRLSKSEFLTVLARKMCGKNLFPRQTSKAASENVLSYPVIEICTQRSDPTWNFYNVMMHG